MQIRSGLGFESWRLGVYLPQVTHAPPEGIIPAPHQRIKCPNPRACLAWVQFSSFTQQGFVEFLLSARSHRRCCGYGHEQRDRKIPILMAFAFQLGKIVNKHVISKQTADRPTDMSLRVFCSTDLSLPSFWECLDQRSVPKSNWDGPVRFFCPGTLQWGFGDWKFPHSLRSQKFKTKVLTRWPPSCLARWPPSCCIKWSSLHASASLVPFSLLKRIPGILA